MKIYVNCNQPFPGMGTKACPFSTIQQAADAAMPGMKCWLPPAFIGRMYTLCVAAAKKTGLSTAPKYRGRA